MTYPTAYDPATNFADEEADSTAGRSTVRTAALDAEFAALSTRIDQIIASLTAIQRSDNALLDGVVTIASLSAAVSAYLTAAGGAIKGSWLTATNYVVKDVVVNGTGTYICAVAHTSGVFATDLAAVKWIKLYDTTTFTADSVTFTPTGGVAASNVQAAIAEVDSEKLAIAQNLSDVASRATAFANLVAPGGSITGALSMSGALFSIAPRVDVAGGATVDLGAQTSNNLRVTGSGATITSFGSTYRGPFFVQFAGANTLIHNASTPPTLQLPGQCNLTTATGDRCIIVPTDGSGWSVANYERQDGTASVIRDGKAKALSAAVAANALTITLAKGTGLEFSDGKNHTLTADLTLTVSSGSTLGTVSGVASRLWVVAMYNSGTPELAVINPTRNGLTSISAGDLISTTAEGGAGGADSAHVWYSTTSRSSQRIAVVGFVESTQATAGTWATTPSKTQGAMLGVTVPDTNSDITLGTAVTASGNAIDFTGIPSGTKRITITYANLSLDSTAAPIIQIGDSGGVETSSYLGAAGDYVPTANHAANSSGFLLFGASQTSSAVMHGQAILTLIDSATNLWACSVFTGRSDSAVTAGGAGSKALSATLDRIRLTTVAGTASWDAGTVNIACE